MTQHSVHPPRIVVVCAANICRSPAAAALLSRELTRLGVEADVTSAGVTAVGDRPACDLAQALVGRFATRRYDFEGAAEVGMPDGQFRSRRLSVAEVQRADLVIVMEAGQVPLVHALSSTVRVERLDSAADIPDPHAIGYESHAAVFARLRGAVTTTAERIAADRHE